MDAVATVDTRGAGVRLSTKQIKTRTDAIDYFNRHFPLVSGDSGKRPCRETCGRIDSMMPLIEELLGASEKRAIRAMRGSYAEAVKKTDDGGNLDKRVAKLKKLHEKLVAVEMHEITGEMAQVVARLLADSEALVCKKMGSAHLRLYVKSRDYSCLCLARKNLENARKIWKAIDPQGMDYAKTLYWLAMVHYMDGRRYETEESLLACLMATVGDPQKEWLRGKALAFQADLRGELHDYMTR